MNEQLSQNEPLREAEVMCCSNCADTLESILTNAKLHFCSELCYDEYYNTNLIPKTMETGIELIANERQKQIEKYGFTAEHHVNHPEWYSEKQLTSAAHMIEAYDKNDGINSIYRDMCPLNWDLEWWQRLCDKPYEERLIISGAFIAAEIDRIGFKE